MAVSDEGSPLAGQSAEDLKFADGLIRSRTGNVAETLADLLRRHAPEGLEVEGSADAPQAQSQTVSSMGYGAVFVEAGFDPDLVEVRVRRVCAAFAAGRIVNPLLAKTNSLAV